MQARVNSEWFATARHHAGYHLSEAVESAVLRRETQLRAAARANIQAHEHPFAASNCDDSARSRGIVEPFPVVDVLERWIPELCERNRNRVQFQILGYDEDSRELYDIPEVREYYRELYNRHPGLFYWIDTRSYMLVFLVLMFYPPVRRDGKVSLFGDDLLAYLRLGFYGLKIFCARHNLPIEPAKDAVLAGLDFLDPTIQPAHAPLMTPVQR